MVCSCSSLRDSVTALLVVTFGTSTWVALGGLWVELPLLTNIGVPEGYRIGSYFIIVTQAAAIGPLFFVALQYLAPKGYRLEIPAIYATLAIGATASFLLIFFWDCFTIWPGGIGEHSTAFLILAFFMSLVDSTSSLTFTPFISTLKAKYLNWYFIGEGLSSVIPSFVVLIQGSGGEDSCVANYTFLNITSDPINNVTAYQNCTVWEVEKNGNELFPPQGYFTFIFGLFMLSTTSYCLLRFHPFFRDQYDDAVTSESTIEANNEQRQWCRCCRCLMQDQVPEHIDERTHLLISKKSEDTTKPNGYPGKRSPADSDCRMEEDEEQSTDLSGGEDPSGCGNSTEEVAATEHTSRKTSIPKSAFLFGTLTLISALTYGVLPSIQSYSAAAYGTHTYLLATAFAEISVPVGFFLVMVHPTTSYILVLLTSLGGLAAGGYCIVTASLSPSPPLQEHTFGQILIVFAWILQGFFFSYCRATIGWILRSDVSESRRSMMWFGGCTTLGTMVGAVVMFPLVSVLEIFKDFDPTQACRDHVTCITSDKEIAELIFK